MKCPRCSFENPDGAKFCVECGSRQTAACPKCGHSNSPGFKFCSECGQTLDEPAKPPNSSAPRSDTPNHSTDEILNNQIALEGERKLVTVLFSDLSGYTAMSEKLDPEEVREIMDRIFGEIARVVDRYEGFIEKFVGDAVMAIFGAPKSHEDDPVRAIMAAREIREIVEALSPGVEKSTGQPISVHSGINTGLVVTGKIDAEKGIHGLSGDTINVASRLQGLAGKGEILVGHETYHEAEGYFTFESLEPATIKGKAEPVKVRKVLSPKDKPVTTRRLSGIRADLIGRKMEMEQLVEAAEDLKSGKGSIFSICGDAGTGKSRLIEDFKANLNPDQIQWVEGHAYAYSQNIPYFPLIDLLNRVFNIEENDTPDRVRDKLESGMEYLGCEKRDLFPYVGSLYALDYTGIKDVSPEFWRSCLQHSTQAIFTALAQKSPTIFFLEDLHWADPSFVGLFRSIAFEFRQPAVVLCAYRPPFNLFTSHQLTSLGGVYREIRLQDLSFSEAQDMLISLLKTNTIPADLKRLVQTRAEGNPFYLEELVNSLIDSGALMCENGIWKTTRALDETEISSSIHGLISGRLDRLEKETKRILQEASVIGRTFLHEILLKITELKDCIEPALGTLERIDMIRTRSLQPELEYMFKHPLTQEVVYNSLLKKERKKIHEQIGVVMEQLFYNRLSEFYETLAFHFSRGRSVYKAVYYLMNSGEKSLGRYAVQESHAYYKEAYKLLTSAVPGMEEDREILFELLNKWSLVYYYLGDFKEQTELLKRHEGEADYVKDPETKGMFYAWLGFVLQFRWETSDSYRYLRKALQIGEKADNQRVIGYACTWLVYGCAVCDKYEEGYTFWKRAIEIGESMKSDPYLYFKSLAGIVHLNFFTGDKGRGHEIGTTLLSYGEKHSNIRSKVVGYICFGNSYFAEGNMTRALSSYQKAVDIAQDPFYTIWPKLYMGSCYFLMQEPAKSEEILREVRDYADRFGCEIFGPTILPLLGVLSIKKGKMSQGLKIIEETRSSCIQKNWGFGTAFSEFVLGNLYFQMAYGEKPGNLSLLRNIGFLAKNVPFAQKKAEHFLKKAIESANRCGAKGIQGISYMGLGNLYKVQKKYNPAKEYITRAIHVFENTGATGYM
ncbi:MAG: adenylate/guanylate cyclase domain-containing protein, partial [Desulfosalsimonas sp.]